MRPERWRGRSRDVGTATAPAVRRRGPGRKFPALATGLQHDSRPHRVEPSGKAGAKGKGGTGPKQTGHRPQQPVDGHPHHHHGCWPPTTKEVHHQSTLGQRPPSLQVDDWLVHQHTGLLCSPQRTLYSSSIEQEIDRLSVLTSRPPPQASRAVGSARECHHPSFPTVPRSLRLSPLVPATSPRRRRSNPSSDTRQCSWQEVARLIKTSLARRALTNASGPPNLAALPALVCEKPDPGAWPLPVRAALPCR